MRLFWPLMQSRAGPLQLLMLLANKKDSGSAVLAAMAILAAIHFDIAALAGISYRSLDSFIPSGYNRVRLSSRFIPRFLIAIWLGFSRWNAKRGRYRSRLFQMSTNT